MIDTFVIDTYSMYVFVFILGIIYCMLAED